MNVKAGDLAITTYSQIPENIGRVVEVVRWVGEHLGMDCWFIRCAGSPMKNNHGDLQTEGEFPDAYLRPVSGLPIEEDTRIEDRVPA